MKSSVVRALVLTLVLCACGADTELGAAHVPSEAAVQVDPLPAAPAPVEAPAAPALPRFRVVAPSIDPAAMQVAISAWNDALGFEVLEMAPADTAAHLADHVYVTASRDLARGQGALTALDADWVYTMVVRPDLVASPRVLAHEFGHVLGGWGHSDVDGDLMYWRDVTPGAPVVISAADVAQVRIWLNLQ